MGDRSLRGLFGKIVAATLAAPVGCSAGTEPRPVNVEPQASASQPEPVVVGPEPGLLHVGCYPGEETALRPMMLESVTTSYPILAIERRASDGSFSRDGLVERRGDLCGAMSPEECELARQSAVLDSGGFPSQCADACNHYVLVRAGTEIKALMSVAEVVNLVQPIDTPHDALVVVWATGVGARCEHGTLAGTIQPFVGGYRYVFELDGDICEEPARRLTIDIERSGSTTTVKDENLGRGGDGCYSIGRRPPGLTARDPARPGHDVLGEYLADVARLEAASVPAFLRLRRELARHGAPPELSEACKRAAFDEMRHASVMRTLARKHGVDPKVPVLTDMDDRTLEEIALDNAVEGCVRETFGALVGEWQKATASDPELRGAFESIAREEAEHAELAMQIASFCDRRLSAASRERVRAAQRGAIEQLRVEVLASVDEVLVERAGLPSAERAQQLLTELERELWTFDARIVDYARSSWTGMTYATFSLSRGRDPFERRAHRSG